MQIHHGEDAGFRLESQHSLEICLVLPSGAMDHQRPLVVAYEMAMDVPGYKNIRNYGYHQTILWLWRKGSLAPPRWSEVPSLKHGSHCHLWLGVSHRSKGGYEVIYALTMVRQDPDSMKAEVAWVSNECGIGVILLDLGV